MKDVVIEYNNIEYPLRPLTIENWIQMNSIMSYADGYDDYILLLEYMTGIPKADILKASKWEIDKALSFIKEYIDASEHKFKNQFEFEGQKYRFLNLENLSFGEFIDIDSFLMKSEIERKQNLHMLMALLYREVGKNNMVIEYDASKLEERANKFKKLDIKYVNGALVFFSTLRTMLAENTHWSFRKRSQIWVRRQVIKASNNIGVGMLRLSYWLEMISLKLKRLLNKIYLLPLIF